MNDITELERRAHDGEAKAQFDLGKLYFEGQGVPRDYAQAIRWHRKAAKQEYIPAQMSLASCYSCGLGVASNLKRSAEWYLKAAEQGEADAQASLASCYESGRGVSRDYANAVEWYTKAAEQGNAEAQCSLGHCYVHGLGVEQNINMAKMWFRKSAAQGYHRAIEIIKNWENKKWYKAKKPGEPQTKLEKKLRRIIKNIKGKKLSPFAFHLRELLPTRPCEPGDIDEYEEYEYQIGDDVIFIGWGLEDMLDHLQINLNDELAYYISLETFEEAEEYVDYDDDAEKLFKLIMQHGGVLEKRVVCLELIKARNKARFNDDRVTIPLRQWFEPGDKKESLYCKELSDYEWALFDADDKRISKDSFATVCWDEGFYSGMLGVQFEEDGLWGFINTEGKTAISPRFAEQPSHFYSDRLIHRIDKGDKKHSVVFDKTGREVTDLTDKYIYWHYNYVNGLLPVAASKIPEGELYAGESAWGYIDINGNEVIALQFSGDADPFICGRAAACKCNWRRMKTGDGRLTAKNERYGIIDDKGNTIAPFIYADISFLYGLPDHYKGKVKIKKPADVLFKVQECGKDGRQGLMNGNGEWLIKPKFKKWSICNDFNGEFMNRKCLAIDVTDSSDRSKRKFGVFSLINDDWLIKPIECSSSVEIEKVFTRYCKHLSRRKTTQGIKENHNENSIKV